MQPPLKRSRPITEAAFLMLGIPAAECQPGLQSEAFKELVNKLAWAIGSAYDRPYNNTRTEARLSAISLATHLIMNHGYPTKIAYP